MSLPKRRSTEKTQVDEGLGRFTTQSPKEDRQHNRKVEFVVLEMKQACGDSLQAGLKSITANGTH